MSTTIYYFTGTGNSLWVARKIGERLGEDEVVPMTRLIKESVITAESDTVGFVFPLYFSGSPDIVRKFVERINLDESNYIFAVVTRGITGGIVISQLSELLFKKSRRLHSAFYLTMPDNYIINFNAPSKKNGEKICARAEAKIEKMAGIVQGKIDTNPTDSLAGKLMGNIAYYRWSKDLHEKDRDFWTDERCNSCGTCVKVCPVDNIELVEGKPSWVHRCEQCYACIHLCPKTSIQIGKKTLKRTRYRHPQVTLKDIIAQKG